VMAAAGNRVANWSFSAFGSRRRSTWQDTLLPEEYAPITATTRRGFTGHEHLDNLSLVHMNGRVYDPKLGRFMSADPVYLGNLANPQSLNPYSYVMNNPLTFTDPSGFNQELCGSDPNCLSVVAYPGGYDIVLPSAGHFVWGSGGSGGASGGSGGSRPPGTPDPESQQADPSLSENSPGNVIVQDVGRRNWPTDKNMNIVEALNAAEREQSAQNALADARSEGDLVRYNNAILAIQRAQFDYYRFCGCGGPVSRDSLWVPPLPESSFQDPFPWVPPQPEPEIDPGRPPKL